MKDHKKSPEFPASDYVRPNCDWVCGHLSEGCPCRIGPSRKGVCRATYECVPKLDLKPGETKGHWSCTRPKTAGGKCDLGPLPDGTCCKAIPKCQPRRTLRAIRKKFVIITAIASVLILFIGLDRSQRDEFINPGPVSTVHASAHFAKVHESMSGDASSCAACHVSARDDVESWHVKMAESFTGGLAPEELIKRGPAIVSEMDQNCLACHAGKDFHQPNMVEGFACHTCHMEHQKSGIMPEAHNDTCLACHASAESMEASYELRAGADPDTPPMNIISSFHKDHPEFELIRDEVQDENTLKFNHAIHMGAGDIPKIDGKELSCVDCHEPDDKGEYQLPITYEQHCAECHALQFDPATIADGDKPGLLLPHGDPFYVRSFVRSLGIQYEEYARTHEGITSKAELDEYVRAKAKGVTEQYESGEFLERAVFFANMQGELPGGRRAPYAGCATCHEVSDPESDNAAPLIAKVALPKRWMHKGRFDHSLHQKDQSCTDCHDVLKSELTSDLNLPSVKTCIECHSPEGGIDHRCMECHTYHNEALGSLFDGLPETVSSEEDEAGQE